MQDILDRHGFDYTKCTLNGTTILLIPEEHEIMANDDKRIALFNDMYQLRSQTDCEVFVEGNPSTPRPHDEFTVDLRQDSLMNARSLLDTFTHSTRVDVRDQGIWFLLTVGCIDDATLQDVPCLANGLLYTVVSNFDRVCELLRCQLSPSEFHVIKTHVIDPYDELLASQFEASVVTLDTFRNLLSKLVDVYLVARLYKSSTSSKLNTLVFYGGENHVTNTFQMIQIIIDNE